MALEDDLAEAVENNNVDAARRALAQGADPNAHEPLQGHMLLLAAYNGYDEMFSLLLDEGANPLATNRQGQNAWHLIAQGAPIEDYRRAQMVRRFKDVGPDPNDPDRQQGTPLAYAALNDLSSVVHALVVDAGAEVDLPVAARATSAHLAVQRNANDALYSLLLLGADPEERNAEGRTVEETAEYESKSSCQQILAHYRQFPEVDPANVTLDTKTLRNPKFWHKAEAVMERLEKQGEHISLAAVNAEDKQGRSALDIAYLCGKLEPVMRHVQRHERIEPEDMQKDGAPTSLCRLLVEAERCQLLFEEEHWQDRSAQEMNALYRALPDEGRAQIKNYHQLRQELLQSEEHASGRSR